MRKLILATAIATLSTSALAAQEEKKHDIDVYGHLNFVYQNDNFNSYWIEGLSDFRDSGSTLGIYAQHEVSPGLTGFARIEVESHGLTEGDLNLASDEAYIGLDGRYGRIWVGKDDSLMDEKIDRTSNFYETAGLHKPWAQYNYAEADRVRYESALLPSYGGGLLQFSASINRTDTVDQFTGDVDGQDIGYEVGVSHATDRFELAGVVSSNRNLYGDGGGEGNHSIGIFGSAKVTDELTLSANFIHNEGNADLPYSRYYSVMTNYTKGKFRYVVSYENGEVKYDGGGSWGSDNFSGQIGYAASDNLWLYVEASVGDYVEDFGMTETVKGTSTAIGAYYMF